MIIAITLTESPNLRECSNICISTFWGRAVCLKRLIILMWFGEGGDLEAQWFCIRADFLSTGKRHHAGAELCQAELQLNNKLSQ